MNNAQGWVTIGFKGDTKQLEKDIKAEERRLQQFEKDAEKLATAKVKAEADLEPYYKEIELAKELTDETLTQAQTQEEVDSALRAEASRIEEINTKYSNQLSSLDGINKKIEENAYQQSLVNNNIKEMSAKLGKVRGFDGIKNSVESIGNSIQKVTKKVIKWGLAFLGIRTIMTLVRQSMSTLSQYDDQMATDVEYIRYAIANTLRPVIEWILNLVKQIMYYVGYIAKAWFGVDIYAKSAAKDFANANKQAKQMGKQLAGFDEMNVLSDTSSSGGGSGTPSFDLSAPEDMPIPGWLDWLARNGDTVIKIIEGIGVAIVALKLAKLLQTLGLFSDLALWKLVAGLALIIIGIIELVQDVIAFLKDPTWEKFGEILTDIGLILAGLAIIIGNIPLAVAAAVALIVGLVISNWDTIMGVLGKIGSWINNNVIKPVGNFFTGLWNGIKNSFISVWNFITSAFSQGGKIFNGLKDGIVNVFKTVVNTLISGINKVIKVPFDTINSLLNNIRSINILGVKPFKGLWSKNPLPIPKIPKLAMGGIVNMPGRGVPVGNAIAGERGAEGVIPLTDSQQMSLLGEAIGRYITVNLTNITELDGRQIARKVDKIQQNNNFVLNR